MHDGIGGSNSLNTTTEMCVAMNKSHRQNKVIEDNVLNIQQHQQEVTPEETKVLES